MLLLTRHSNTQAVLQHHLFPRCHCVWNMPICTTPQLERNQHSSYLTNSLTRCAGEAVGACWVFLFPLTVTVVTRWMLTWICSVHIWSSARVYTGWRHWQVCTWVDQQDHIKIPLGNPPAVSTKTQSCPASFPFDHKSSTLPTQLLHPSPTPADSHRRKK